MNVLPLDSSRVSLLLRRYVKCVGEPKVAVGSTKFRATLAFAKHPRRSEERQGPSDRGRAAGRGG